VVLVQLEQILQVRILLDLAVRKLTGAVVMLTGVGRFASRWLSHMLGKVVQVSDGRPGLPSCILFTQLLECSQDRAIGIPLMSYPRKNK
jgi:ABC-type cobalamin transport system permease subunit